MSFASVDGLELVGSSTALAHTLGAEFVNNINTVKSASEGMTNYVGGSPSSQHSR